MQNIEWYNNLNKPFLNPPDWVFAPAWTILYILITISFILFIRDGMSKQKVLPLLFFLVQIILNFLWTPAFFIFSQIKIALIILIFIWIFLLLTIITFYKHSKTAAILLIPYFIWTSFAFYLNLELLRLN